jgi:exopolysaccharide biosynthesis polyprenyl glycosylphosphotransferase
MLRRTPTRLMIGLFVLDLALTVSALFLARTTRVALAVGRPLDPRGEWLTFPVFVIAILVSAACLYVAGVYDSNRLVRAYREVSRLSLGVLAEALILAGALYFLQRTTSRLLIVYYVLMQWILIVAGRLVARTVWKALPSRRIRPRRVLVVGAGALGEKVGAQLMDQQWLGVELVGYLDDDLSKQGTALNGLPVLGTLSEAVDHVSRQGIDDVVIALPLDAHLRMANLVAELQDLPVSLKVVPDFLPLAFARMKLETLGEMPLIGLSQPALSAPSRVVKRAMDIVVSGIALVAVSPILPIIALAVRLDSPGPAIFRQRRLGENERLFFMLKFRTMVQRAEEQEEGMLSDWSSGRTAEIKPSNDPRITRVGRFLRKSSIDELPQLINVLRGDMSLVGPRPEMPALAHLYQPWQRKRFRVPQGMTGWWQLQHRGVHPMCLHAEDDLYYFRNYSLLLDIQILLRTGWAVLRGRGAR